MLCIDVCMIGGNQKSQNRFKLVDLDKCQFYYDLSFDSSHKNVIFSQYEHCVDFKDNDRYSLRKLKSNRIDSWLSDAINQQLIP